MSLIDHIGAMIPGAQHKTLIHYGAYDDTLARPLAAVFKSVDCLSDRLRTREYTAGNLAVRRGSYSQILADFHRYDVVLVENAFHQLPDVLQMLTYDRLGRYQELLLAEWDMTGNIDPFYRAFHNRAPLCQISRDVLNHFLAEGEVVIEATLKGRYTIEVAARSELLEYFRYLLPDHFPFGEKECIRRAAGLQYPVVLWEGYDLFKVRRFDYV